MTGVGFTFRPHAGQGTSGREDSTEFAVQWRRVTYSLALVGFLSLVMTGEIEPLVILLFIGTWIMGLAAPDRLAGISRWVARLVYWSLLAGIGWLALLFRFESLLYLLFFLTLFKCLRLREPIDHLQVALLSFFMLLACSTITSSIGFLPFLILFCVLMLLEMQYYAIGRERHGGPVRSDTPIVSSAIAGSRQGGDGLLLRLFWFSVVLTAVVLGLAMVLFLLMPHYSPQGKVSSPWVRKSVKETDDQSRTMGYSDDLSLGVSGRFVWDNTEVMTVKPAWLDRSDRPYPAGLHLRGMALDQYEGNRWSLYPLPVETRSVHWRRIPMPLQARPLGPVLRQNITQNITLAHRLFGASFPIQFSFGPDYGFDRNNANLILNWRSPALGVHPLSSTIGLPLASQKPYMVYSILADEATPLLRRLLGPDGRIVRDELRTIEQEAWSQIALLYPRQEPVKYPPPPPHLDPLDLRLNTALPQSPLMDRIGALSRLQAPATTAEGKVLQLVDWFRSDFEYSLEPDLSSQLHPIETFLFRSHTGHCEYFATGLALMLRAQGIPARVVIGFFTSEWSADRGGYIARQSDAHAWTEVWLEGMGWMTIDPTPPDWRGRAMLASYKPPLIKRVREAIMFVWRNYLLDYSNNRQAQLLVRMANHPAIGRLAHLLEPVAPLTPGSLPAWGKTGLRRITQYTRWFVVLAGLFCLWGLYRLYLRQRQRQTAGRSPVGFLNRLLDRLGAMGWRRPPSQTVGDFLAWVEAQTGGRWQLDWLSEQYHRVRWASQTLTAEDQRRIRRLIDSIRS